MPLIDEKRSFVGDQELKFKARESENFNQSANFNNAQAANVLSPKGLFSLPPALMQLVPWIPLMLEMTTGQKVPQMTGTMGEIQSSLQQVQFSLTQLISSQQQLQTRLENLEHKASSQLNNLSQQLNNNFRLIANETKRSLEFSQSRHLNEPEKQGETD